jgi:hypothetical protein
MNYCFAAYNGAGHGIVGVSDAVHDSVHGGVNLLFDFG